MNLRMLEFYETEQQEYQTKHLLKEHFRYQICFTIKLIDQLDVDPQRDDDASPMSTYRCMLRPT